MNLTSCLTEGKYSAEGLTLALIAARFNQPITLRLVEGARDCLKRHGAAEPALFWVPGSFELPLVAKKLGQSGEYDAIICLGAIIRGETAHFDYVAHAASTGILQASLETGVPIIFSVLTTENWAQAEERCGLRGSNAGFNGALTAIEMAHLMKQLTGRQLCDLKN